MSYNSKIEKELDKQQDLYGQDAYQNASYRASAQNNIRAVSGLIRQQNATNAGMQAVAGGNAMVDNSQNAQMVENVLGKNAEIGAQQTQAGLQSLAGVSDKRMSYYQRRQQARDNMLSSIIGGITGLGSAAIGSLIGKKG